MAQAVLKLNCTPSMSSTFGELSWLPITEQLDIIRIGYYLHLLHMPEHRLTKMIFNELKHLHNLHEPSVFNYFANIKSALEKKGHACFMLPRDVMSKHSSNLHILDIVLSFCKISVHCHP